MEVESTAASSSTPSATTGAAASASANFRSWASASNPTAASSSTTLSATTTGAVASSMVPVASTSTPTSSFSVPSATGAVASSSSASSVASKGMRLEWFDEEKNFSTISQRWRDLPPAPSREAAWWRFALAPLLLDQGVHRTPLPPLTYTTKIISAGSIFAMDTEPIVRMLRPVLYEHLVHGRVAVLVNFFSESHMQLFKAFQIGGVPCSSPSCKGRAMGGWDTEALGWSTETRAPLEYIDKFGVSNGTSIMRGRCNLP
jgi:hypothetical protein